MKTNDVRLAKETSPIPISCQLTSPALQQRKRTVIASLQKRVLEKKELPNGYAYRFAGTDRVLDELNSFIKTERQCCRFFNFSVSVQSEGTVWLELTGPEGTKEFIDAEIELTPSPTEADWSARNLSVTFMANPRTTKNQA